MLYTLGDFILFYYNDASYSVQYKDKDITNLLACSLQDMFSHKITSLQILCFVIEFLYCDLIQISDEIY